MMTTQEQVLVKRINRHMRHGQQMVRKTRGRQMKNDYGEYYIHDFDRNTIVSHHVDVKALGREMGLLPR